MGEDGVCTPNSKVLEELAIALITNIQSAKLGENKHLLCESPGL